MNELEIVGLYANEIWPRGIYDFDLNTNRLPKICAYPKKFLLYKQKN